jgi:CheY-like chemotaxis protein
MSRSASPTRARACRPRCCQGLRSVLHHQAAGAGDGPGPVDDLWLRPAVARPRRDRQPRKARHDDPSVPAAPHGDVPEDAVPTSPTARPPAPARPCWSSRTTLRPPAGDAGAGGARLSGIETADGRHAVPILESSRHIDLLISDVGLPGLNGRQLAEIARESRPGLPILFMTGYAGRRPTRPRSWRRHGDHQQALRHRAAWSRSWPADR